MYGLPYQFRPGMTKKDNKKEVDDKSSDASENKDTEKKESRG